MFGSLKKKLGIEGVKIELIVSPVVEKSARSMDGIVKLTSLSDDHIVTSIYIKLVEKYTRGRGNDRLINEYVIGEISLVESINISKNDIIEVPFTLPFVIGKSEMDKLGDKNFITRGLVSTLKKISGVESTYYLMAEATVEGTKLHPMDKKKVDLK